MSSPSKKLTVEVKSAVRDGFCDRGWRPVRGDASCFQAPEAVMGPSLVARVPVTVDSYRYGGATLTADVVVQDDEVTEVLVGLDRASLPSHFSSFPGDQMARRSSILGVRTAGGLVDPGGNYHKWLVTEVAELIPSVEGFFAMVDGPMRTWLAERDEPSKLLERFRVEAEAGSGLDSVTVRTGSVLALLRGDDSTARLLVQSYALPGLADDPERIALFERELARHFPTYGPPQRD